MTRVCGVVGRSVGMRCLYVLFCVCVFFRIDARPTRARARASSSVVDDDDDRRRRRRAQTIAFDANFDEG